MREALRNLFSNKITTENNISYHYHIQPFELKNALGNVVAMLQQYTFSNENANHEISVYTLFKTKEGNWYDVVENELPAHKSILRMLKTAIDKMENEQIER